MLQLVFEDDWVVPVPIDGRLEEALEVQRARALHSEMISVLSERLSACIATSLSECLDADLRQPSERQVGFAADIARELGIPIPADALRYRGAMTEFLDRHVGPFRERQAKAQRTTEREP